MSNFQIYIKVLFITFMCSSMNISFNCQHLKTAGAFSKDIEFHKNLAISRNVSMILDKLLKGYDKRLRPNYAGPPVEVGITININNINSVSEVNMDYTMDMFFRQMWTDRRLSFDGVSELVIGSDMLHKIWVPDTYIANDRKTYFHKATVKNKFIRINPDGQVLYSMRMTVTAACPMDFRYFPMDHQECDLEIESYGFRMEDIKYKWAAGLNSSAVDVAPNIELPQLKYKEYKLIERQFRLSTGLYSRLTMKLFFSRSLGYFITQIYIPSTLIVALSWVSFWLDRTAAPARVSLGITTVLTMVTFIWSTNASLPKISYIKGIDVYLVCCFFMTFASVIEYAMVSYVHHRNERRKRRLSKRAHFLNNANRQIALLNNNYASHPNLKDMAENSPNFNISSKSHKQRKNNLPIENYRGSIIDLRENDGEVFSVLPIQKQNYVKCTCNLHQLSSRQVDTNLMEFHPPSSKKDKKHLKKFFYEHPVNDFCSNELKFSRSSSSNKNKKNYKKKNFDLDEMTESRSNLTPNIINVKRPEQSILVKSVEKKKKRLR
ncbi:gamma-aminobutyric acid receptor subunit beta isoform X16, partial [Brachionus plicatilis]